MISGEDFRSRLLPYEEFAKKAASKKVMVIDVREPFQVNTNRGLPQNQPLKVPSYRSIPSDKLVAALSKPSFKRALKGKTLLLADAVGKQVRWLQYFLQENGYRDYYFLQEGVLGASKAGGTGLWR
jgi:rhodanese-related sulfurtransferase